MITNLTSDTESTVIAIQKHLKLSPQTKALIKTHFQTSIGFSSVSKRKIAVLVNFMCYFKKKKPNFFFFFFKWRVTYINDMFS